MLDTDNSGQQTVSGDLEKKGRGMLLMLECCLISHLQPYKEYEVEENCQDILWHAGLIEQTLWIN